MIGDQDRIFKQLQSEKGLALLFLKTCFAHLMKWLETEKPDVNYYYEAKAELLKKLEHIEATYVNRGA